MCVLATPVLLLLAVGSAGAGHADGTLAHVLFPFATLLGLLALHGLAVAVELPAHFRDIAR